MVMEMFDKAKPYMAMISLQFGYAGTAILTKISLNEGMNQFVLVVYRHISATIFLSPFAFFLERNSPKITFCIYFQIFALGFLGPVMQNFYYLGLKFTSPTVGTALLNIVPAATFVIAFIFRMEKISIRKIRSQAKIVGTLVCVGGAMLMTFYKGCIVPMPWSSHHHYHSSNAANGNNDMVKGCLFLIILTLSWASFYVLQASVLKKYPAQLSLVTLICLMGSLQSIVITLAVERRPSAWALGFNMNLLTAVYSGVIGSGIAYYLHGLCMKTKGPVFTTAFMPLTMIITAIMDSLILHQRIYLGSVLGGVVIVMGLYAVLWGKVTTSSEMLPTGHSPENMKTQNCGEAVPNEGIVNIKSYEIEEN